MDFLAQNLEKINLAPALKSELASHQIKDVVSVRMNGGSDFEMTYRGVSLYHSEQPVPRAAAEIQQLQGEKDQDLVVYFGLGFGIHSEFLKKRFNAPLLVFDPSLDILKTTLSLRPLFLDDFSVECNFGRLSEIIDRRLELSDRRVIVAIQPGYKSLFPRELERFKFVVQQAANSIMIRHNTLGRGSIWARHEIENIRHTLALPPLTELKKYANGVPGVFIGAGPSLSKNIELIKRLKNKSVIIAAATALRPLDKAGVLPDIAMVIESNASVYQFEGIGFLDELTLAPTPYSHPDNFLLPVKQKMSVLNHPTPTHDWMTRAYDGVDAILTAGSVALAAFSALHRIGCDPIIALGMDLAFTENQTHAKGADSAAEVTRYNKEENIIEYYVENPDSAYFSKFSTPSRTPSKGEIRRTQEAQVCAAWGGNGKVFSDVTFTAYRAWLEGAADTWAGDRTLINATEGGACINGFKEMKLSEVIDAYGDKDCNVQKWLEEICQNHTPRALQPMRREIEAELSLIRRVNHLAKEAELTAARTIKLIKAGKLNNAQTRLEGLSRLEKEMGALTRKTRVLNQISQQATTSIRLKRHEDKNEDQLVQTVNSLNRSIILFQEIIKGANEVLELFELALSILSD